jgi:hypothetical protein
MVFTDGLHLVALSLDELHNFAEKIGLSKSLFIDNLKHPYYNISSYPKNRVIEYGACVVSTKRIVEICKYSNTHQHISV